MTESFAEWIRDAMRRKGVSVRGMAEDLGTGARNVQNWRMGATPRPDRLPAIAEYFEVDLDYLRTLAGLDTDAPERPSQPIYLRVSIPSQELVIRAEALGPVSLVADPASSDLERQLLEQFRTLKPTDQASLVDAVATMAATAAAQDAGALPGQQRRQRKGA